MDFDEYQNKALETAIYPNIGHNLVYPVIGLAGEIGEFMQKMVKCIYDYDNILDSSNKIPKEILLNTLEMYAQVGLQQNKLKKLIRDEKFVIKDRFFMLPEFVRTELQYENGDIKWYNAMIDFELRTSSGLNAQMNLNKLDKRKKEGKVHGSGDDR